MGRQPRVTLVTSGHFDQIHVYKVAARAFQSNGWRVTTFRIENCWHKTCLHSKWDCQPEQCLEFSRAEPHQTQLRHGLIESRLGKANHVIVFADRYEEGFLRRWWHARMFKLRGIKLCVVQVGERYSRKGLEYLAAMTGGEYRRISHDKYIEGEMPALLEFTGSR